jgi:type VI secretion system secreted protein VgrG
VLVDARTKAMMASGGASMTIENGNVVFNCPGEFRIKAASFTFEGPGDMAVALPQLPVSHYQPNPRYSHTQ